MQSIRQLALDPIRELPEAVDPDEIMYRLHVLDKVRKGQQALDQGRVIDSEERNRRLSSRVGSTERSSTRGLT